MGIGTTYLIMDAVASVPWLAGISLTLLPPVVAPMALIAGAAYGLLIYNSLTDMLLEDSVQKFRLKFNEFLTEEMTPKRQLILALSILLFLVSLVLTVCSIGTWVTVFHKTESIFQWIGMMPNVLLNFVIPGFIGLSVLPFSFQSVTNTLDSLELNPNLDSVIEICNPYQWNRFAWRLPNSIQEVSEWLLTKIWDHWIPGFLGISQEEFTAETLGQRLNPWRIIYQLCFQPLRNIIFIGHLVSAGATQDQIQGVPVWVSFWLNFWFECAEDWDWIWGRVHQDKIGTVELVKERVQNADDHNHDKNFPIRLLNFIFSPILWCAAQWAYANRVDGEENNIDDYYQKLQGMPPQPNPPNIPAYRKNANFNLFLFKSTILEPSCVQTDFCCGPT